MIQETNKPRFMKLPEVSSQTGMGKSTILAWESQGRFPRAVRLSKTIRVWLENDINNWIALQSQNSKL
jgi:prophage regulatory protein